jgi:hypothetical protein
MSKQVDESDLHPDAASVGEHRTLYIRGGLDPAARNAAATTAIAGGYLSSQSALPTVSPSAVRESTTIAEHTARVAQRTRRVLAVEIIAELVCVVVMRRLATALSVCLCGCGDNQLAATDAATDAAPFQPAPHARLPIVFPHTGTVLSTLQLVTLTFDDYAATADAIAFGDAIVASSWYRTVGAEYGTSTATHVQHLSVGPAPAELTRDGVAALVGDFVAHDAAVVKPAAADNQVLYLLYLPPRVGRGASLVPGASYHDMLTVAGARAPFAVVLDEGLGLAAVALQAAHQIINAATNPYLPPRDGYYADPPKTDPWSLLRREIADLCEGEDPVADGNYRYPRVYSASAAAADQPPCAPARPGDSWSDVSADPSPIQRVAPGGSVTFTLTGWSTSPQPPWQIRMRAPDSSDLRLDQMVPSLSSDTINNSDTVTLTLVAPADSPSGTTGGVEVLSGDNLHPWAVGMVVR